MYSAILTAILKAWLLNLTSLRPPIFQHVAFVLSLAYSSIIMNKIAKWAVFSKSRDLERYFKNEFLERSFRIVGPPFWKKEKVYWSVECRVARVGECKQNASTRMFISISQQDNKIESLNCRDLCELQDLVLCNNSMTSIHGLDGCTQLRTLDLQNNKITRIGTNT